MSCLKNFVTLTCQRDFNLLYRHADKVWHTPFFVLFYKASSKRKVAFVAGKKVGGAVRRNRAKRLLRARFIAVSDHLTEGSYIFVAKAPLPEVNAAQLEKAWRSALEKAGALPPAP